MKKILIPVLIILVLLLIGYKFGFKSIFYSGVVEKVREKSIEEIKKQADDAEKLFKNELESAEKAGRRFEKLGNKYIEHKDWTPAIQSLKKAIEYGQSGARVHYSLGAAYANRGMELSDEKDAENAEKHYRRAYEINPKLTDAKYGLAILMFYMKKKQDEAISVMKSIVSDEKDYYRASFALGRFYYEIKQPSKALSVYERLYSNLEKKQQSPKIKEYKKKCKDNISRIMLELSGS